MESVVLLDLKVLRRGEISSAETALTFLESLDAQGSFFMGVITLNAKQRPLYWTHTNHTKRRSSRFLLISDNRCTVGRCAQIKQMAEISEDMWKLERSPTSVIRQCSSAVNFSRKVCWIWFLQSWLSVLICTAALQGTSRIFCPICVLISCV